jgi:hypothetical protein
MYFFSTILILYLPLLQVFSDFGTLFSNSVCVFNITDVNYCRMENSTRGSKNCRKVLERDQTLPEIVRWKNLVEALCSEME